MAIKKVPVTIGEGDKKRVIGTATVDDSDGEFVVFDTVITDPEATRALSFGNPNQFSIADFPQEE